MKNTHGFSLIELLLVVVLLGFVLIAVVQFGSRMRLSGEARKQTAELTDRQSVLTSQLKKDFEAVGSNLPRSSQSTAAGQVAPFFLTSRDYQVSVRENSANITRFAETGETELYSAWGLVRGNSEISFVPQTTKSAFGFRDADNNVSAFYFNEPRDWKISAAGENYSAQDLPGAMSDGDGVTIALDWSETGGCAVSFYFTHNEERRFIFRRRINCAYRFQVFVDLQTGGSAADFNLRGSFFDRLDDRRENGGLPLLPTKNGVVSPVPVWIESGGESFTLLKSDLAIDPLPTLTPVLFEDQNNEVEVTVANVLRGALAVGDFCLLIDDSAQISVLVQIIKITPQKNQTNLIFLPVNKSNPAWDDFYSQDVDFLNRSFPPNSRLVRLSAPVAYRLASDERVGESQVPDLAILRREGIEPWEKVAFGVTRSQLTDDPANGRHSFIMKFSILPEQATSVEPRLVQMTFSPSALNQ